ncbi:MAG: RelA/SpoT family protein [Patescibacteria group bacterium]
MKPSADLLVREIKKRHPDADTDLVVLAYDFAAKAHEGQQRISGDPYIVHPFNAGMILAKMGMDDKIVAAALLHDVPEESGVSIETLEKEFGKDIAFLVEGVTKTGKVKYRGVERYLENLRKMFIAMAVDLRVIIIRFADRIDNLRTLNVHEPDKAQRIAEESLEIYAPIANRLGMGDIKDTMEDLAFQYALPEEFKWVSGLAIVKRSEQERYLKKIEKRLEEEFKKEQLTSNEIAGRVKRLYSLYLKLLRYDRDINQIHDLVALRVIVPTVGDCYRALGIIHQLWPPLAGRIKDYIAQPKSNGYQSIHTTVFTEDGRAVEFQIRTPEMHQQAEYGIAAHWYYDEAGKHSFKPTKKMDWVKELGVWQKEIEANQRKLQDLKVDVLKDRIFVFTPKGDVVDLPVDSTPVDFAYAIHSDIGDKCSRAYVNDTIVNLDHRLNSGDIVEVLIDKNRKGPSPDWLKFVQSSHAKARIRASTRASGQSFLSKFIK